MYEKKTDLETDGYLDLDLRLRAEAQLAQADKLEKPILAQVAVELLNELHTKQKELQKQNEALQQAQHALAASSTYYVELYDFAPIGYITLTIDGMIANINQTAAKLLGLERKLLINRSFVQFIPEGYKAEWEQHCVSVRQDGLTHSCELPIVKNGGVVVYVHLDSHYANNNKNAPQLRITLSDITERKQAEEQQLIAAVAFETQDGIIIADANKTILRVNQAFTRITGYSAEETVGKPSTLLKLEDRDRALHEAICEALANESFWQGEVWEHRKNGQTYPIWLTITCVIDSKGSITHYVGSFTDISAQKQAEKILLESRVRLESQVANTQEELERIKLDTSEVNSALNILLKHRETDKSLAQTALSRSIAETVLPFLNKLKSADNGRIQSTRLIDIIETNLKQLTKSYGSTDNNLPAVYQRLTRVEVMVASMVRQGLSTKAIASTLNLSTETINNHRKHIRKKLNLEGKASNLHSFLLSLSE